MTTDPSAALAAEKTSSAKSALAGFLNDFKDFQTEIKSKMTEQDTRIAQLGRKSAATRPALSGADPIAAPHQKAMNAYLRAGDETEMKSLAIETKALSTAVQADGGFLVDPQTADSIAGVLRSTSSIRSVASVATVEAGVYDVLVDHVDLRTLLNAQAGIYLVAGLLAAVLVKPQGRGKVECRWKAFLTPPR